MGRRRRRCPILVDCLVICHQFLWSFMFCGWQKIWDLRFWVLRCIQCACARIPPPCYNRRAHTTHHIQHASAVFWGMFWSWMMDIWLILHRCSLDFEANCGQFWEVFGRGGGFGGFWAWILILEELGSKRVLNLGQVGGQVGRQNCTLMLTNRLKRLPRGVLRRL